MTLSTVMAGLNGVLPYLALSAIRTLAVAACAGLALSLWRPRSTSTRIFIWTSVLYAGLTIPLLGWMLPAFHIPLPALTQESQISQSISQPESVYHFEPVLLNATRPTKLLRAPEERRPVLPAAERIGSGHNGRILWSGFATAMYLAVTVVLLVRFAVGLKLARRLVKRSGDVIDPRVRRPILWWSVAHGMACAPETRESEMVSAPLTIGTVHPTILLPSGWRQWEDEKLDAVIAHEMSHVVRKDALTQTLSLLQRAIFWFSPLSWWLERHLANLAEQASDEAALSGGADRHQYARTLLGFFECASSGRVWWQGVAMGYAGQAEKRMQRILSWRGTVMGLKKSGMIMILVFAVPVIYLAAAVVPAKHGPMSAMAQATQEPAPASVPSPPAPSSSVPSPAVPAVPANGTYNPGPEPASPVAAPSPAVPPAPASPVPPDQVEPVLSGPEDGFAYGYGFDDEQRFVIVTGKTDSLTMSGSSQDARHVEKLRKQIPGDFIWFQRDEKSYIIQDHATIDRALQLWVPQKELGKKQSELGKQQAALGKQQAELGAKMRQVQVKVPDMTAELDKLRAELKELSSGATSEQVGKLQAEMGELQAKIGRVQAESGEQQARIGAEMGELGEKQGALGRQQGELGQQQGELARRASEQMKQILDEALKKGLAQPEPAMPDSSTL